MAAVAAVLGSAPAAAAEARYNAVGPPLDPIAGKLADRRWLVAFLLDPASLQPGTAMPKSDLSRAEAADMAAYLYSLPRRAPVPATIAAAGDASAGARLFVERGCRGCHAVVPGEIALGPNLSGVGRKVLPGWLATWIRSPRVYHAQTPMPALPLSDAEVTQIVAYLSTLRAGGEFLSAASDVPSGNATRGRELVEKYECNSCHKVGDLKPPPAAVVVPDAPPQGERALEIGRALVAWYRCRGCHVIEGDGGTIRAHLTGATLAPPTLDGEGARVQPSWLVRYLRQPSVLRSWLHIRMPAYDLSEAEAKTFAAYFAALAGASTEDEPLGDVPPPLVDAGQRHFDGYRCIQCHPAAGKAAADIALADRSIDLTLSRGRLRPSWIARFLARPAAIAGSQTRMPSVFYGTDGSALVPSADEQIAAISAYMLHMDQARAAAPGPTPAPVDWTTMEY